MSTYKVVADTIGTETHYVDADSEEEAREMVLSGDSLNPIVEADFNGIDSIEEVRG